MLEIRKHPDLADPHPLVGRIAALTVSCATPDKNIYHPATLLKIGAVDFFNIELGLQILNEKTGQVASFLLYPKFVVCLHAFCFIRIDTNEQIFMGTKDALEYTLRLHLKPFNHQETDPWITTRT